ncbi:ABC transporter permease [Paenibacillus piri]|uniref:ABC transporter permease n=1 Tax=Paenibacillus piri TaxID=2547395 RepID=UPI00319DE391
MRELSRNKYLYIMALPGIAFLITFAYLPMFGHLLAFKRYQLAKGVFGSPWVGFDNFKFFFSGGLWLQVTYNTIFLNGLFITLGLGMAIIVAILLNEIRLKLFKRLFQSIIFLPYFISWVAVSLMVNVFLNSTDGFINRTLEDLGLPTYSWYSEPGVWPAILTLVYVWKFTGYKAVIFLAAIAGISEEYYESARLDGASRLQLIWHITLPQIQPVIIVLSLLAIGRIFYGDFGMIYGIIGDNGMLLPTTDVIDTYSFRALRQMGNFGMASAVVLYQSFMGLLTILLFNWIVRRTDPDSKLF